MAKVRQGILGGFRGRVGNIVGTGWKGIAVMKSLPLTVANPRTAGQVKQRNKFSKLVSIGSRALASIIKPLWDRFASNMSGFNAFISANQRAFDMNGNFVPDDLIISRGRMLSPVSAVVSNSGQTATLTVTNPVGDRFALPTDRIFVLAYNADLDVIGFSGQTAATRGAGATVSVPVTIGNSLSPVQCSFYFISYLRSDGSEVSNSLAYVV